MSLLLQYGIARTTPVGVGLILVEEAVDPINDTYEIKGTIKNKNNSKLTDVFATYAFYDNSGNVVGTRFCGYYKGYKKGQKFSFKETCNIESDLNAVKCKVVEVHGFNI